jgi:hypothetical protein
MPSKLPFTGIVISVGWIVFVASALGAGAGARSREAHRARQDAGHLTLEGLAGSYMDNR